MRATPFVIAGVLHYGITDVHPFADGNGRVARLAQTALLMRAGVLPGRMFSFERYYAEDRPAYYAALRSVRLRTLNMEFWLGYFLKGLAEEYERVAAAVVDLSALMPGGSGAPLRFTAGQERGLTALRIQGRREFNRREYEQAAGVSRSTAAKTSGLSCATACSLPAERVRRSATCFQARSKLQSDPRDRDAPRSGRTPSSNANYAHSSMAGPSGRRRVSSGPPAKARCTRPPRRPVAFRAGGASSACRWHEHDGQCFVQSSQFMRVQPPCGLTEALSTHRPSR